MCDDSLEVLCAARHCIADGELSVVGEGGRMLKLCPDHYRVEMQLRDRLAAAALAVHGDPISKERAEYQENGIG